MQTKCPHCATLFRVTEIQVNAADGFVRCGACKEVFNAIEVASKDDHQHSLLNETGFEETAPATYELEELEDIENINFNETSATDESRKDAFDFFNEDSNESHQHVVPDKFRDSHLPQSQSVISTLLWSIGILFLTATLLIEYVWFNREQFNQIPELQAAIEKLCKQIECKNIKVRDPAKIQLVSRNVYSHPNEKGALMVNVTMINNADFAQPYPVMQIDFSDIRGGTVAARRFLPTEYLQVESEQLRLLQPDVNTDISLEIQDPGKQAMTYEFNFI